MITRGVVLSGSGFVMVTRAPSPALAAILFGTRFAP